MVARPAARRTTRRTASCSTASRATCRRPRRWEAAGGLGHQAGHRARARRRRRRGRPAAVRPAHLPGLRPDLARACSTPPARAGICDDCGGELFQRDDDRSRPSGTGSTSTPSRRAADQLLRRRRHPAGHRRHRAGGGDHRPRHGRLAPVHHLNDPPAPGGRYRESHRTGGVMRLRRDEPDRGEDPGAAGHHARGRAGGRGRACAAAAARSQPGISTAELDAIAEREIRAAGAVPSFKGYSRLSRRPSAPRSTTQIVHGIPSAGSRCCATAMCCPSTAAPSCDGWHGDSAAHGAGRRRPAWRTVQRGGLAELLRPASWPCGTGWPRRCRAAA